MEQFPALNAECFDQKIAERLQLQEPPRILILYGSFVQPFRSGRSGSSADGDGRRGETV